MLSTSPNLRADKFPCSIANVAQRIVKEHADGEVTKEDLIGFKVEDFDLNLDKTYRDERPLGFTR